ncbi:type I-C CRISPR-associated protein Cas8c/Csd1 [Paracoccus yeei]|uniref:type I-C CRISPR-associated protein Cas8c/Csd1 n=1 Tax=Paracoccus yeei TaxID=147645 RepID=UPI00048D72E4|nr:type I-C CRISPR-associated protein Cas8c/Csd1 [Paracoccus yeei]OWJ98708.1 type I-C CRISPR-associated protein Cas8c/Csd1 [Paracoccus yeei]
MSLLSSLLRAYDRLPDAPPFGFSSEKIGFCILLNADGTAARVEDLRGSDKKRSPRMMLVPQAVKRTAGIAPNFLWDKSAYVLGVTEGDGKRTAEEHAAFRTRHAEWLAGTDDRGLLALLKFLRDWSPDAFAPPFWPEELRDQNIVFALADEYREGFLHERPAAREAWRRIGAGAASAPQTCLVTGDPGPVARLHPSIKGVWGAQSSGASLVSFNLDAFTSYGHEQGDNAPVSEAVAFAYGAVLNRYLDRDSGHRIQIGDASTVFWADCSDMDLAAEAELWTAKALGDRSKSGADEMIVERDIEGKLLAMRDGKPLREVQPDLAEGVRIHLLGLSPNAARLSVRFYWEGDFGTLADHYADFLRDVAMEPAPQRPVFSIRAATLRTAPAETRNGQLRYDGDRISPLLSGELLRAIITGGRFPRALLGLLVLRVRSDHVLDRIRIALIKGLILRDMRLEGRLPKNADGSENKEYLMRADPDDPNPARRLGRLFALIERAQLAALGDGINATVKDKFLGAAAATPGRVFPNLLMNAENHHLKRLRNGHSDADWIKDADHARRVAAGLGRDIGQLWASLAEGAPLQHSTEEQGLFLVGYYQERYAKRGESTADDEPGPAANDPEE